MKDYGAQQPEHQLRMDDMRIPKTHSIIHEEDEIMAIQGRDTALKV
jgi:hypothetical protein